MYIIILYFFSLTSLLSPFEFSLSPSPSSSEWDKTHRPPTIVQPPPQQHHLPSQPSNTHHHYCNQSQHLITQNWPKNQQKIKLKSTKKKKNQPKINKTQTKFKGNPENPLCLNPENLFHLDPTLSRPISPQPKKPMFGSWVRSSELSTQKTSDSVLLAIRLQEISVGVLAGSIEKQWAEIRLQGRNHMYSFMGWGKEKREGENIEDGETKTGWWERTREIKGKQIIKKLII